MQVDRKEGYSNEAFSGHWDNNMEGIYTPNHIVFDFVEDM